MRRPGSISIAVLFVVIALAFSVVIWPEIPAVAKLAFFGAGVGCGVGAGRSARTGSRDE